MSGTGQPRRARTLERATITGRPSTASSGRKNDTTDKSIAIPINKDDLVEGTEDVNLELEVTVGNVKAHDSRWVRPS